MWQIILCFCITYVYGVLGQPTDSKIAPSDAVKYLYDYGYLDPNATRELNPHALPKTKQIEDALANFQRLYHLPVSGRLDKATTRLMLSPRCGNKDPVPMVRVKRFSVDDKTKWGKRNISFKITAFPTNSISTGRVRSIFRQAFNMWSRVANLDFYEEKNYYTEADIIILFGKGPHGDAIPFDGPGKVLAHAYFPHPSDKFSRSGDAHFDDAEQWSESFKYGKNLLAVAVHELGHSLGISHSGITDAIMYPFYGIPSGGVLLHQDDIDAIQTLYGPAPPDKVLPTESVRPDDRPDIPPVLSTPSSNERHGPNVCDTSVDAVVLIRGLELYIFKDDWLWRVGWSMTVNHWYSYEHKDGPQKYFYYWPILPNNMGGIDTGFESDDGRIYIFRGRRFWLLLSNEQFETGFSYVGRNLTDLGLPESLNKIDTMFVWGYNNKIYIFAGDLYWQLDDKAGEFGQIVTMPRYPRRIKDVWKGVPTPVDAAFTGLNGVTYFFQGKKYYAFNNFRMQVKPDYPKHTQLPWLGCKIGTKKDKSKRKVERLMENTENTVKTSFIVVLGCLAIIFYNLTF